MTVQLLSRIETKLISFHCLLITLFFALISFNIPQQCLTRFYTKVGSACKQTNLVVGLSCIYTGEFSLSDHSRQAWANPEKLFKNPINKNNCIKILGTNIYELHNYSWIRRVINIFWWPHQSSYYGYILTLWTTLSGSLFFT